MFECAHSTCAQLISCGSNVAKKHCDSQRLYVCVFVCVLVCVCVCVCVLCVCVVYINVYIFIHTNICIIIYIKIHVYKYVYTYPPADFNLGVPDGDFSRFAAS